MSTTESAPQVRVRNPYLDNAKAILITLVVIGHPLNSVSAYLGGALETWIYAFHMPAFVMISGYLSRSFRNDPKQISRLLTSLLAPYLIFQLIHAVLRVLINGSEFSYNLLKPSWTLWFLLALFIWRLCTPLLQSLRHPLAIAVTISILAPLAPELDSTLTIGRVLSFLPFFVIGLLGTPERLERIRDFRHKWVAAAVLAGGFVLSLLTHDLFPVSIFHMSASYEIYGASNIDGMLGRIVVLIVSTAACFALLTLTPKKQYWWTNIGVNSLTVYLLHAPILLAFRYSDAGEGIGNLGTLGLVAGSIVLTLILSRQWVVKLTTWLTNPPIGHWLVKTSD